MTLIVTKINVFFLPIFVFRGIIEIRRQSRRFVNGRNRKAALGLSLHMNMRVVLGGNQC